MGDIRKSLTNIIRDWFHEDPSKAIPLHEPSFTQEEELEIVKCVKSTFVSSVGPNVDDAASMLASFCDVKYAIPVYSGTAALHLSLIAADVKEGDIVITQSFTFIATINSILYCHATPMFIDIDADTLCLSPHKLQQFLEKECVKTSRGPKHLITNKIVKACIPMYSFGLPGDALLLKEICSEYRIKLVEDAAESLGSKTNNKHLGTIGDIGVLSFNGNKIITAGSGGMVLTNNKKIADNVRHLSNQAKVPHPYEYQHDQIGYNYRMPNLNASLLKAQILKLPELISMKQELHNYYRNELKAYLPHLTLMSAKQGSFSNYWLNTVVFGTKMDRQETIENCISNNIMVRPPWQPAHTFDYIKNKCIIYKTLSTTTDIANRALCLPSSVKVK